MDGGFDTIVSKIAKRLRRDGKTETFNTDLLHHTATALMDKMVEGYGSKSVNIAYDSPDVGMLHNLRNNVYQFSAAKNYNQLKDMTLALMDGDKLRSEPEFVREVERMNLQYNRTWLNTERHTAIASGQMASRWVDFERDADIMPMLQYSTVGDGRVRNSHKMLDGVVKEKTHTFWDSFYPPNGYRCRCDVIQVIDPNEKPTPNVKPPLDVNPMFKTNLAKTGLIFPEGHPYYKGIDKLELRKAIEYLPAKNSYTTVKAENGSDITVHITHDGEELVKNLGVANDLIKLGYKDIKLLPTIHEKQAHLKARFYPPKYVPLDIKKNADAWVKNAKGRNLVCEFKNLDSPDSLDRNVKKAAKQAPNVVLKFMTDHKGVSNVISDAQRAFTSKANTSLNSLIVFDKDGNLITTLIR